MLSHVAKVRRFRSRLGAGKLTLAVLALTLFGSALVYALAGPEEVRYVGDPIRDYRLNPYGFTDATEDCLMQAKLKFEGRLLHSHIDMHSSRYEQNLGYYLIVVKGDVNEQQALKKRYVYCHIRPKTQELAYLYASDQKGAARAKSFFQSF